MSKFSPFLFQPLFKPNLAGTWWRFSADLKSNIHAVNSQFEIKNLLVWVWGFVFNCGRARYLNFELQLSIYGQYFHSRACFCFQRRQFMARKLGRPGGGGGGRDRKKTVEVSLSKKKRITRAGTGLADFFDASHAAPTFSFLNASRPDPNSRLSPLHSQENPSSSPAYEPQSAVSWLR